MRYLFFFLFSLCPLLSAQSLALDVFDGDDFAQVDVALGANSLLGFDAAGQPARVTAGTGITISGNVISSSGGGGSATLASLTDVTLSSPANNQLLRYNSASAKWVNWTPSYLTAAEADNLYASIASPWFSGEVNAGAGLSAPYIRLGGLSEIAFEHASMFGPVLSRLLINTEPETERDGVVWYLRHDLGGTLAVLSDFDNLNATNLTSGTVAPARLGVGTSISTKFLRGDGTWQTISGGGDALTSGTLAQFAPTTSAQLRGVLSDESGTGEILTTNGSAASLTSFPTLNQNTTGNAATATALQTSRTINGVSFNGSANITIPATAILPTMTGNGGKFLRVNAGATDYELATISGGGDAVTSGTLAQFAPTTSAQLRGVLSDESGTGEILTTNGSAASLTGFPTLNQNTTGNAATATALQTARTINGVSFNGSANITIPATAILPTMTGNGGKFLRVNAGATDYELATISGGDAVTSGTLAQFAPTTSAQLRGVLSDESGTGEILTTSGNGSSLTGLTQSQVSGLTTTDRPQFANLRLTHSTLTYAATVNLDLDGDAFQTLSLTGSVTFTTSNRAASRSKTIRIIADGSARNLTFPAGWVFVGAAAPASIAASKSAVLTVTFFGTADSDAVAAYAAQP